MSRSYGSVLPTSLTHIVPSARGFSPRRPAAVVGTTDETSHAGRPPRRRGGATSRDQRIFKGRRERTGRRTNGGALPVRRASRRLDRFQARRDPVNERRQLSPGLPPTSPVARVRVVADAGPARCRRFGNIDPIPFHPDAATRACGVQDRLTRVRLPLTRNPRPRRPSKVSFE